jgi:hypothetical protein
MRDQRKEEKVESRGRNLKFPCPGLCERALEVRKREVRERKKGRIIAEPRRGKEWWMTRLVHHHSSYYTAQLHRCRW